MHIPIVVSLATYGPRLSALGQTLPYILAQTLPFDILLINVQDDVTEKEADVANLLAEMDPRIKVAFRPAKWHSFNKFIHAYKEYPDSAIITVDDDIRYPSHMLKALYDEHLKSPSSIIAHELNPVGIDRKCRKIRNIMSMDLKLPKICFSKYLTGCALFPAATFDGVADMLFDYDRFQAITEGTHDELWLWMHSTIQKVPVIGLDYTYTFDLDGALPPGPTSLRHKNGVVANVEEYDRRINADEDYGPLLFEAMDSTPVVFNVTRQNLMAMTGYMGAIRSMYGCFKIVFDMSNEENVTSSMRWWLWKHVCGFDWPRRVELKFDGNGGFTNGKED